MMQINPLPLFRKRITWYRTTRRRNKVFVITGIVILLLILVSAFQNANSQPNYVTSVAKKADIIQLVSETGNINTSGRSDIYSNTTGIIDEIYVDNGMDVATGDSLFSVRSTATEADKAAAYAAYQSAISAQTTSKQGGQSFDAVMWTKQQALLDAKNAKNYKDTHDQNPATNAGYTDLEKASIDAAVVQAEKDFRSAEQKYKESGVSVNASGAQVYSTWLAYLATQSSVVYAPTYGTIANLTLSVGDNVTAGTGMASAGLSAQTSALSASLPVLTIANLRNNYTIKVSLNEVDIPKLKRGQDAIIAVDAFSGKRFSGTVTQVDAVGTNNAGVVTYNVNIAITNPIPELKPGMTASVDIEVDKAEDVLSVPNSSVKPYKGGRAVRTVDLKTKKLIFVPVEVGVKGEDKTQILKGIKEGQEVIVSLPNDQVKRPGLF